MKPLFLRALAALLLAACPIGLFLAMNPRTDSAKIMTDSAKRFLLSLTPEQRAKTNLDFASDERFNWHFTPIERKGLALREMTPTQRHLAYALLAAGLSQQGYIKATTIMSLEDILRILENDSGERRNPEKYYVSVFGTPSEKGTWSWRFEGHHLSLHFTLVEGQLASSPTFLGANPAEVRQGPRQGLRILAAEEDLARELLNSLSDSQRKIAVIDPKAPAEILTYNKKTAVLDSKLGISMAQLTPKQRGLLTNLLNEYIYNLPDQLALAREQKIRAAGQEIRFAWMGPVEKGALHYYRVQSPTFLIEYDNTQNNGNHIHSVWRDFDGDFGLDLLAEHLKAAHAK